MRAPVIPHPNAAPAALPRIRWRGRYPRNVTSMIVVNNARALAQREQALHAEAIATAQDHIRRYRHALAQWEAHLYGLQAERSVHHG